MIAITVPLLFRSNSAVTMAQALNIGTSQWKKN